VPKPPFRTISREVAADGVEELVLRLGRNEKRMLKTERRLELTLDISFIPTEGANISRTQTVVLTTRCKPTRRRPFC
jgi:hypothetical protein